MQSVAELSGVLDFVLQPKLCVGTSQERVVHTPLLPWLVRAVRSEEEFAGLKQSGASILALDAYGPDPWHTLEASGLFEPGRIADIRAACLYDDQHTAFFPTALCTSDEPLALGLPTNLSKSELEYHHERARSGLLAGRWPVSRAAREALGDGYTPTLTARRGVSLIALLECELTDGSLVLGWGWTWHPVRRRSAGLSTGSLRKETHQLLGR